MRISVVIVALCLSVVTHAGASQIRISSVYNNFEKTSELKADPGFACVIRLPGETILFDTGRKEAILLSNMRKMGIDPGSMDKVVISHAHRDHTGGLQGFLKENDKVAVFIPASFSDSTVSMLDLNADRAVRVSRFQRIADSVYTTGELRAASGEQSLLDNAQNGPEEHPGEQSLILDTQEGLIIVTGCAHAGIVDIVKKARELMDEKEVHLVLGGFHHPSEDVAREFREMGVKNVAPAHCSGDPVRKAFAAEYGDSCIDFGVGRVIDIRSNP